MALEKAKEIIASSPVDLALRKAKETVASHPVVVFSKTYCPFCTRVKQLLAKLGASYKAIELDVESEFSLLDFTVLLYFWFTYLLHK
uniref:Glutaredoxin domain-containing protein n=1 Tax=Zea mays TaxID=4577 RepID=B6SXC2_MAIZE|nr:hypothetical protein [Zea mays]